MNAVDFETYHKLHTNINNILEMREISDDLCRENGLSVIPKDTIKRKYLLMDTSTAKINADNCEAIGFWRSQKL